VLGGASPVEVMNPKTLPAETPTAAGSQAGGEPPAPKRLDLATLYTSRGLFTGTARMPIPSSLDAHLYVPAGAAGTALANLAARMGMEATGLTLPLASPAPDAAVQRCTNAGRYRRGLRFIERSRHDSCAPRIPRPHKRKPISRWVKVKYASWMTASDDEAQCWPAATMPVVHAALDVLSGRFPNSWEPGKPYLFPRRDPL